MEFPLLNNKEGLDFLEKFLAEKSYISDFEPTQNDVVVFKALGKEPDAQYVNVLRWYKHVKSLCRPDLPSASVLIKVPNPPAQVENEVEFSSAAPFLVFCPLLLYLP